MILYSVTYTIYKLRFKNLQEVEFNEFHKLVYRYVCSMNTIKEDIVHECTLNEFS